MWLASSSTAQEKNSGSAHLILQHLYSERLWVTFKKRVVAPMGESDGVRALMKYLADFNLRFGSAYISYNWKVFME